MIQEVIRSSIESKLNDNTYDKVFIVGSYAYLGDKDATFLYSIKSNYTLIETSYIPVMMTFVADYAALPGQINGIATIALDFLINSRNEENQELDLNAMNEIVSKVVGNYEDLVDGTTTFHTVWNMDALTPAGVTEPINGVYYTVIKTNVYIEFSDSNLFGNAYRYYLDGKALNLYDGNINRENEENYPHRLGEYEAEGGIDTSQWTGLLVSYVDSNLESIVDGISSNTYDMEKVYTYSEYKNGTLLHTFPVKISSLNRPIKKGEKQYVSIGLIKSDQSAT